MAPRYKFTSFSFNSPVLGRPANPEKAALFHKVVQGIKLMLSICSANPQIAALLAWYKLVPHQSQRREGESKKVERRGGRLAQLVSTWC